MISKLSSKDKTNFLSLARHFGIAFGSSQISKIDHYADIEGFFLFATESLSSARLTEGFLCWVKKYGHLLSPSKVRRMIRGGEHYDASVLGGLILFLVENNINSKQWAILEPFVNKSQKRRALIKGPLPKKPNPYFLKYNIIVHNYQLNEEKFLTPTTVTYKNCIELKNRALFGSTVHADVASYLFYKPEGTPYEIAKATFNHKARVFEVHKDIKIAL